MVFEKTQYSRLDIKVKYWVIKTHSQLLATNVVMSHQPKYKATEVRPLLNSEAHTGIYKSLDKNSSDSLKKLSVFILR